MSASWISVSVDVWTHWVSEVNLFLMVLGVSNDDQRFLWYKTLWGAKTDFFKLPGWSLIKTPRCWRVVAESKLAGDGKRCATQVFSLKNDIWFFEPFQQADWGNVFPSRRCYWCWQRRRQSEPLGHTGVKPSVCVCLCVCVCVGGDIPGRLWSSELRYAGC